MPPNVVHSTSERRRNPRPRIARTGAAAPGGSTDRSTGRVAGGGGSGRPVSAVTRASISASTFSDSSKRPLASYQRGDSGRYRQASTAKMIGRPPRKNITRQPVLSVTDGMSTRASSGDRKYPTDRNESAIPVNRPRIAGGHSSAP